MAIQTFTSGQVLTAAQVNALQSNDFNQTVTTKTANTTLVAADKGTRVVMNVSTASTITVNTSIFSAGDTVILQNIASNASTVTAGTATVSSAGSLAIPQFGSGTLFFTSASASIFFPSAGPAASSGLTLISSTNLTGSSITFTNAFSASFRNYLIQVTNLTSSSGTPKVELKLGSASNGHNNLTLFSQSNSVPAVFSCFSTNAAFFSLFPLATIASTFMLSGYISINAPQVATRTAIQYATCGNEADQNFQGNGMHNSTTQFTDFTFRLASQNFDSGTLDLYGYGI